MADGGNRPAVPTMRRLRRFSPLWLASLGLLLVYAWTLTETAEVRLRVSGGRCTAELYGRSSTIDCPGLAGGRLLATVGEAAEAPVSRGRGLLGWLLPGTSWRGERLAALDGAPLAFDAPLPPAFTIDATLRRPDAPGVLVLAGPDGRTGWAFIIDAAERRGAWWAWADGPETPMQGIPLDRPFSDQLRTLIRQLLDGWQGALLLLAATWLAGWVGARAVAPRRAAFRIRFQAGAFRGSRPAEGSAPRELRLRRLLAVSLAVLFAFAVALHVALHVLDGIPHVQDSVTYLFQAQTLARAALAAPAPPLAEPAGTAHFAQEFLLVRDGRWFGKYPPGYPALLAVGVRAGAPWLVNPLLAALTVPLLTALYRALYGPGRRPRPGALLGSLLLAVSPFFLVMSGSLMAHPAELFWTALFMAAWAKAAGPTGFRSSSVPRGQRRWAVVAGVAIGALCLTRQFTAATIGLSFGGGWLWLAARQANNGRARGLPGAVVLAALAAVPFLLTLLIYQAAVTGNPWTDPRLLYWPTDRVGFGPGIGEAENAFTAEMTDAGVAIAWYDDPHQPPRGHTPARGLYNLGRNLDALATDLFAWPPLLTLAFVWLAFLARRPAATDWLLLAVVLAVSGGYVAYWASGVAYGPRYFYAALPALALLTARGVSALAGVAGRRATAAVLLLLLAANLLQLPGRLAAYRDYNFVSAAPRQAVEAQLTAPALVFVTASEADWWEYGAFFSGNTPWLDGSVVYARDLGAPENARLAARFPGRAVWLWRDGQLTQQSSR